MKLRTINICDTIIKENTLTIYKIVVFDSDKKPTLLVFIGNVSSEILSALSSLKLQKSKDILIKTYGKNYASKLGITLMPDMSKTKFIQETIYDDDMIFTTKFKISSAIDNNNPHELYMWCHKKIYNQHIINNFILNNIFAERSIVSKSEIEESVSNYRGKAISLSGSTQALDYENALYKLSKHKIDYVAETIGFKYMKNDRIVFFPVDPSNKTVPNKQDFDIIFDMTLTIESLNIDQNIIYVATKDYFKTKEQESFYLPEIDKRVESEIFDYIESSDEVLDLVHNEISYKNENVNKGLFTTTCFLKSFHIKHQIQYQSESIDIESLFANFILDESIPFLKYVSKTNSNTLYKVFKPALKEKSTLSDANVKDWSNDKSRNSHDVVVFKIHLYGNNTTEANFASLYIYPQGIYDVKYSFPISKSATTFEIENSIEKINTCIKRINLNNLPPIERGFWLRRDGATNIQSMHMLSTWKSTKPIASITTLENTIKKLFPYFFILDKKTKAKDELHILYKRVDHFSTLDNVLFFLYKHSHLDQKSLIQKMKEVFGVTDAQAMDYYKNYGKNSTFQRFNTVNVVSIRIKVTNQAYNVSVDGVNSIDLYKRIMGVLFVAFKGKTIFKAGIEEKGNLGEYSTINNTFINEKTINGMEGLDDLLNDIDDVIDGYGDGEDIDMDIDLNFNLPDVQVQEQEQEHEHEVQELEDDETLNDDKKYILPALQKADKALFVFNSSKAFPSFAKTCQMTKDSKRQPVVINKAEKDRIDKEYPGSYNNFVQYGTTPELANKNYYICPQVWCPKTRIAMNREAFERNNNKCPLQNEYPIVYYNTPYYVDKKGNHKNAYVRLREPTDHPNGFQLPCCFTRKPTEVEQDKLKNDINNARYIVQAHTFPLVMGRFGLLPQCISNLFGKMVSGTREDGTGLMTNATDAYLRQGIQLDTQCFLQSMVISLDNKLFKSVKDLIKIILKQISIDVYIMLQGGLLCKLFMDDNVDINDYSIYFEFKKWFLHEDREEYITLFNLQNIQQELELNKLYEPNHEYAKQIKREFLFWISFKRFLNYISDEKIIKTHDYLLDLFTSKLEWLNTHGYNIIVCDLSNDFLNMSISCNQMLKFQENKPTILLTKYGTLYEPILRVTLRQGDLGLINKHEFNLDPRFNKFIKYMMKTCVLNRQNIKAFDVLKTLNHLKVKWQVIDYDFKVIGFVFQKDLFIPLKKSATYDEDILMLYPNMTNIFANDMFEKIRPTFDPSDLRKILKTLDLTIKSENQYYIELDNNIIPLKKLNLKKLDAKEVQNYMDDANIFIRFKDHDPMNDMVDATMAIEKTYIAYKNEFIYFLKKTENKKVLENIKFLRRPINPIPREVKRSLLREQLMILPDPKNARLFTQNFLYSSQNKMHVGKYINRLCTSIGKIKDCKGQCKWIVLSNKDDAKKSGGVCRLHVQDKFVDIFFARLLNDLVNPNIPLQKTTVEESSMDAMIQQDNVIIFSDIDVKSKKLDRILETAKSMWTSLGLVQKSYIVDSDMFHQLEQDAEDTNTITLQNLNSTFLNMNDLSLLPSKIRPQLKLFKASVVEKYTPHVFYSIFAMINNKLRPLSMMTPDEVRTYVNSKIILEYGKDQDGIIKDMQRNQNLKGYDISHIDKLNKYLSDPNKYPSMLELTILAKFLKINIILIHRATNAFPGDDPICIGKHPNPEYYLLLNLTNNATKKCDIFSVVVKAEKEHYLFKLQDFDKEFAESLSTYCTHVEIFV